MGGRGGQPIVDLGRADNARDVVGALIADRGLRPTFRDRLEQDARREIERLQRDAGSRRDLTAEPTFTVDPASARDFDDAVSARREGDGFRLWIHIADVAAHVKPDSGLDREAFARANSTYAPGTVSPMLPGSLSSDACSLMPDVERLAVTAEIELSAQGEARSASFYRSRIRSDVRLDYDQLDVIFAGRERAPEHVADAIDTARAAAAAIAARSAGRGLEVSGSEPEFTFTPEGDVAGAHALVQTESHRLIEKLMILTNEQVALLTRAQGRPVALPGPRAARSGARRRPHRPARHRSGSRRRRSPRTPARARPGTRRSRRASSSPPRPSGAATGRAASRRWSCGR